MYPASNRWALLGALGCIVPELDQSGTPQPVWFKAGAQIFAEDGLNYLGSPALIHASNIVATLAIQVRRDRNGARRSTESDIISSTVAGYKG